MPNNLSGLKELRLWHFAVGGAVLLVISLYQVCPTMLRVRDVILPAATLLTALAVNSTVVWADCRSDVEAAFQKLAMLDRPYRSEMTIAGPDLTVSQGYRETTEFIPPDRMRKTADSPHWFVRLLLYFMGQGPIETIRIGDRTWERVEKKWVELPYGPKFPQEAFAFKAFPPDAAFACLEAVRFERRTYAGYQASFRPTTVMMAEMDHMSPSKLQEERERALKILREAPPKMAHGVGGPRDRAAGIRHHNAYE